MGKKSPAQPAAPDPATTANAQAAANQSTAAYQQQLNMMNQYTPYGSLEYNKVSSAPAWDEAGYLAANPDVAAEAARGGMSGKVHYEKFGKNEGRSGVPSGYGAPDRYSVTQTLSPSEMRQLELSNNAQETYGRAATKQLGQVEGMLSQPFNPNLPDFTGGVQDRTGNLSYGVDTAKFGQADISRDAVEKALLGRMAPIQGRDRAALETKLAGQGIGMGSQAWNGAMDDLGRQENDARFGAVLNAGQEQSRVYGLGLQDAAFKNQAEGQGANMDLARAQFGNGARGQSLQEQLAMRSQPINEASSLLTGQMIQQPQWMNAPNVSVAPVDYMGAQGQYLGVQQNAYNQQLAQNNASRGAAYGLAGSVIGGALGSVVPGVGTVIGAGLGGALSSAAARR